jgi:hypothetical protein
MRPAHPPKDDKATVSSYATDSTGSKSSCESGARA